LRKKPQTRSTDRNDGDRALNVARERFAAISMLSVTVIRLADEPAWCSRKKARLDEPGSNFRS
jgi:hypothetical protein